MDVYARIEQARARAEGLKNDIITTKQRKCNGTLGHESLPKLKRLGNPPRVRRTLKGHFGKVYAMYWAGDSQRIVSASQDGKLLIWNGPSRNKIGSITLRSAWVMTTAFEQTQNRLVACGGLDNVCSVFQIKASQSQQSSRPNKELTAHDGYISCCRFVGEENMLTSSGDATCIFWDTERGEAKSVFKGHSGDIMCVSIQPNQNRNVFVSASCDATTKVWDVRSSEAQQTYHGHESDVNSVDLFPDGRAFGTGSDDSTCRLFDMRCYSQLNEFSSDKILCGITSVAFSKSGRLLFAGYDDYTNCVWDTSISSFSPAFGALQGHENRVSCLGVSPSGEALCTGSWDTLLKIWA